MSLSLWMKHATILFFSISSLYLSVLTNDFSVSCSFSRSLVLKKMNAFFQTLGKTRFNRFLISYLFFSSVSFSLLNLKNRILLSIRWIHYATGNIYLNHWFLIILHSWKQIIPNKTRKPLWRFQIFFPLIRSERNRL